MSNKRDIVAQVIGLLVMEHGLFLAAVRVAPPALATLFVVSLFCYVLVTLTILLWILPALHRASRSIQLSKHSQLRG
jgi:hydrogenase-4 membrane subunit HyfE